MTLSMILSKITKGALCAAAIITISSPALASSVGGFWLTENKRAVIEIEEKADTITGYIHWIIEGGLQKDINNPDPSLRDEPMCGLGILWGFEPDGKNAWDNGRIYKADDGDTYHANVELLSENELKVRGHVGISLLGKTQIFTRVDPKDYPQCKG